MHVVKLMYEQKVLITGLHGDKHLYGRINTENLNPTTSDFKSNNSVKPFMNLDLSYWQYFVWAIYTSEFLHVVNKKGKEKEKTKEGNNILGPNTIRQFCNLENSIVNRYPCVSNSDRRFSNTIMLLDKQAEFYALLPTVYAKTTLTFDRSYLCTYFSVSGTTTPRPSVTIDSDAEVLSPSILWVQRDVNVQLGKLAVH